jgi:adenosylhomocysteine nucleosidase
MSRIAIVAALEREVKPLIADWQCHERDHAGRKYRFFEKNDAVLVCGGMGAEAARRATEAAIVLYAPSVVYSVGLAGALQPGLRVGDIVTPRQVLNAIDGSSTNKGDGDGILVTIDSIANEREKARLAASYGAIAVDMEAAHVARGAEARGVRFAAIKVISDEVGFVMPPLQRFVSAAGNINTSRFLFFALLRPWLWPGLVRLGTNSRRAARSLGSFLEHTIETSAPQ